MYIVLLLGTLLSLFLGQATIAADYREPSEDKKINIRGKPYPGIEVIFTSIDGINFYNMPRELWVEPGKHNLRILCARNYPWGVSAVGSKIEINAEKNKEYMVLIKELDDNHCKVEAFGFGTIDATEVKKFLESEIIEYKKPNYNSFVLPKVRNKVIANPPNLQSYNVYIITPESRKQSIPYSNMKAIKKFSKDIKKYSGKKSRVDFDRLNPEYAVYNTPPSWDSESQNLLLVALAIHNYDSQAKTIVLNEYPITDIYISDKKNNVICSPLEQTRIEDPKALFYFRSVYDQRLTKTFSEFMDLSQANLPVAATFDPKCLMKSDKDLFILINNPPNKPARVKIRKQVKKLLEKEFL